MIEEVLGIFGQLGCALGLTILVEWGLAHFFVHSKFGRELVILVQCLTNPVVNLAIIVNSYFEILEPVFIIAVFEGMAVVLEAVIYRKGIGGEIKISPFRLSLMLNLASFVIGMGISFLWFE